MWYCFSMKEKSAEKYYTVHQIANMLKTNPETVRRWIRDNKLNAIQTSRKDGNIVTEDDFQKFLKSTPKYLDKLVGGLTAISPFLGIATLAGTVAAGAVVGYQSAKNKDTMITSKDLRKYLKDAIDGMNNNIVNKNIQINKLNNEIEDIAYQIKQYETILSNEDILTETAKQLSENLQERK